jgi:hypothetical protein
VDESRSGPLIDEALAREIETALAVDPSPEFVVRLRSRVAEAPATSVWPWRWEFAGLAVAIVASVWVASAPTTTSVSPIAASSRTEHFMWPAGSVNSTQISGIVSDARRERTERAVVSVPPPFPEVIISLDEVRAFRALIRRIEAGQVHAAQLAVVSGETTTSLAAISIEPLATIEPLEPLALLEGARP